MGSILTLAGKDLTLLKRDKFGLFWIMAFPLMFAFFFGAIFSGAGGPRGAMPIVVVDEDRTEDSAELVQRLGEHESLGVGKGPDDRWILHDLDAARRRVRTGSGGTVAYVRIKPGYGERGFALFGPGDGTASIEVGIDPARGAEAGYLQGVLMEVLFGGIADRFRDKEAMREQIAQVERSLDASGGMRAGQKLVLRSFLRALDRFMQDADTSMLDRGPGSLDAGQIEIVDVAADRSQTPRSSFEVTFPSAIVWGLMGCAAAFAITIVRERTMGTLLRLKIAPITRVQLLAGKGLACFLACSCVIVILLLIGSVVGLRLGNVLFLALAITCTSACFTGIMMAMSVLGKTEAAVAGGGWGIMMPFAMIGGGMVPLISMPPWMQTVSNVSPFKWGILSIEGAVWRRFTLTEMVTPCVILLAIGVVFFAVGVWVFNKTEG